MSRTLSVNLVMKRISVVPFRPDRRPGLTLPFALPPEANAAQISVLPEFEGARPFRRERWNELQAYRPSVLIGYGFDLQRLAQTVRHGDIDLTTVDRAIFALTDSGSNPVSEKLREDLWRTFGVPLYELIVVPGCRLLASECEAHDGWHVQADASAYSIHGELVYDVPPVTRLHTGFTGEIETSPCPCGRPTPRLQNLVPCLPRPYEQHLAAAA